MATLVVGSHGINVSDGNSRDVVEAFDSDSGADLGRILLYSNAVGNDTDRPTRIPEHSNEKTIFIPRINFLLPVFNQLPIFQTGWGNLDKFIWDKTS